MKFLIVNADDYGLTEGVCAGIRKAHLQGVVTSTTVLMNSPNIDRELDSLLKSSPRIGAGVHLVITAGKPILPFKDLPTLQMLSNDGVTFLHDLEGRADRIDPGEVEAEWRAQIELFIRLAGRKPDHLDAHHHAMGFSQGFLDVYARLARAFDIPVRRPVLSASFSPGDSGGRNGEDRLFTTDCFDSRFFDDMATSYTLDRMVASIRDGTSEWMCHPGEIDEALMQRSGYNRLRSEELRLLTRPELRQDLMDRGVELITFKNLAAIQIWGDIH